MTEILPLKLPVMPELFLYCNQNHLNPRPERESQSNPQQHRETEIQTGAELSIVAKYRFLKVLVLMPRKHLDILTHLN